MTQCMLIKFVLLKIKKLPDFVFVSQGQSIKFKDGGVWHKSSLPGSVGETPQPAESHVPFLPSGVLPCRWSCASGRRQGPEGHWSSHRPTVSLPWLPGTTETEKTQGLCSVLFRHERHLRIEVEELWPALRELGSASE